MSINSLLLQDVVDEDYDEIKSLVDSDPSVLQSTDNHGQSPIHIALFNKHITLRVVQLLLDSWPESIYQQDQFGNLPIHLLCENEGLDEVVSVQILTVFLEASPESVQRQNSSDYLPIHTAARYGKSSEFIKLLVNSYPQSVRIPGGVIRMLPIHLACESDDCRLDSVKYLLDIYPESINVGVSGDYLPIHNAASSCGPQKAEIIKYILMTDPTCASKAAYDGKYPLHLACDRGVNLIALQLLFDACPEAILETSEIGETPLGCFVSRGNTDQETEDTDVINFLQTQRSYANISPESLVVQDENGWSPLYHALKDNAPLGSIKLLIKGCALAIRVPDYNNAFPLHIACEFSSAKVVQYLMEMLDECTWNHLDVDKDSILHYACRGGNCDVVKYLVDKQSPYVSERNADKKLPIHLLCQFGLPSNSLEHTDTIYRLLLAYPGTVREYM